MTYEYPKFITSLPMSEWTEYNRGSHLYLKHIDKNGVATYHCPDAFGCWDLHIMYDGDKFIGVDNVVSTLDKEWYPLTDDEYIQAYTFYDYPPTLEALTDGKYK